MTGLLAKEQKDEGVVPVCMLDGNRLQIGDTGAELLAMLLNIIDGAHSNLKLYYYIFAADRSGRVVLARLIRAARRGIDVTLIVDAFGSANLPSGFFDGLVKAGGKIGWFGPGWSTRYLIRNHQKMAIADGRSALIGGFNVSDAYFGRPEEDCWHDLGLRIDGVKVESLVRWYDRLWRWVSSQHQPFRALRAMVREWCDDGSTLRWLVGGPTRRLSPWAQSVRADLGAAKQVDMVAAYFSPGNGLLACLRRVARRGRVRIILPSRSDNGATVAASRLLYGPLLRRGVGVFEYQPCRLHMKLIVVDSVVYIGSANFDMRSLFVNVELMLRIDDQGFADEMRAFIDRRADESTEITLAHHRAWRTPWRLVKGWLSYFLVAVLDYTITRRLNFRE